MLNVAKWTRKYIDSLPDSAFLLVLSGGEKEDGKTEPLSLRKFPVRDKNGKIDKDHLDNALARIPQSNISSVNKKKAKTKAENLLEEWKEKNKKMKKSLGTLSYQELRDALQQAVKEKYGTKSKDGYWQNYPWVGDIYETEFVVEYKGKYYIGDYVVEDGQLTEIGPFYPAKKLGWAKASNKAVDVGKGNNVTFVSK